jgi:hypothetical protein
VSAYSQPAGSSPRTPATLNSNLNSGLLGYAAAASAAGIGLMGLAQPSQAEIVYTPAHQTIDASQRFALDINNDGITDFEIVNIFGPCTAPGAPPECSFLQADLNIEASGSNRFVKGGSFIAALQANVNVGPGKKFAAGFAYMENCNTDFNQTNVSGPWVNVRDRYLGLSIVVDGQVHYGWARLTVTLTQPKCHAGVILTGYAYETDPGKPIATGATSGAEKRGRMDHTEATLGALAAGSAGLVAWRRDDNTVKDKTGN